MVSVTIPQELRKEKELVLIPRRQYEEFLSLKKVLKTKMEEIMDTDSAVELYQREKKQKKLRVINSLADLS